MHMHAHTRREAAIARELREAQAQHELLQLDYMIADRTKTEAVGKTSQLQAKCQAQTSTIDSLNDQLGRYRPVCLVYRI